MASGHAFNVDEHSIGVVLLGENESSSGGRGDEDRASHGRAGGICFAWPDGRPFRSGPGWGGRYWRNGASTRRATVADHHGPGTGQWFLYKLVSKSSMP